MASDPSYGHRSDRMGSRSTHYEANYCITVDCYVHSVWANDHELEIAMNDETPVVGGTYLALCIIDPPGQTVNAIKVKGFLDTVKGEGASRGIFITTGYFSDEAIRSIDEEPVELVDIVSFVSYLKRFGIYENLPS